MENHVLISVIIPAFNVAEYINDAVSSIMDQQHSERTEIIVVDDNSQDGTQKVVEELCSRHKNLRYILNSGIKGAAGARNTGIVNSVGEWIWFLDADDVLEEGAFQNFVMAARSYPKECFFTFNFSYLEFGQKITQTDRNENWAHFFGESFSNGVYCKIDDPLSVFLQYSVLTCVGSAVFRRDLVKRAGYFDEDFEVCEDWLFWTRIARAAGHLIFIPTLGMIYRIRPGSLTRRGIPTTFWAVDMYKKLYKSPDFEPYRSAIRQQIKQCIISNVYFFRRDNWHASAVRASFEWIRLAPFEMSAWRSFAASLFLC